MNFRKLARDDRGATLVEYGLLVSVIACVLAGVLGQVGQKLIGVFNYLLTYLPF